LTAIWLDGRTDRNGIFRLVV